MTRRSTRTLIETLGAPSARSEDLRQPDDRDESSSDAARAESLAPVQRDQMTRAQRDAEGPGQDTDCRRVPSGSEACTPPGDPGLLDDVLRPDDPGARDAENRRTAQHDPGAPPVSPDGGRED